MPAKPKTASTPPWWEVKDYPVGKYEKVPLDCDDVMVAAMQMNPMPVDAKQPAQGIKRNLDRMLGMIDMACASHTRRARLLVFPEFTLTGWGADSESRTRADWLRATIMVPGPETEAITRKAKQWGCYVAFASHIQEPDWPGHFFNCSVLVGPAGVIHTHWKAYDVFPGCVEFATQAHDVLDQFVERYGWDALWPVARTPIGNIATYTCSEGFMPEAVRAYAMKGAEIICRCMGGGGRTNKSGKYMVMFRADCAVNDVYGIYGNGGNGDSIIVDPFGRIMNQANGATEQVVADSIPIAAFRKNHAAPTVRTEIYLPEYERHPYRFPPNMYSRRLPADVPDAVRLCLEHARW